MTKKKADILTGIVNIVVAAAFYVQGRELEFHSNVFPLLLEAFLVITGLYLIIRGLMCKGKECSTGENINYNRAFIMVLATVFYIVCVNLIGFYVSSFAFLTLMSWFLSDRGMNLPSLGISFGFAIVLTGAMYLTFTVFLGVPTPAGFLF